VDEVDLVYRQEYFSIPGNAFFLDFDAESVPPPFMDSFRFERAAPDLPADGRWQMGFTMADMNEDGMLDIVVPPQRKASPARPTIFIGDDKGNFSRWTEAQWPNLGMDYGGIAVADFDKDGHQDISTGQLFQIRPDLFSGTVQEIGSHGVPDIDEDVYRQGPGRSDPTGRQAPPAAAPLLHRLKQILQLLPDVGLGRKNRLHGRFSGNRQVFQKDLGHHHRFAGGGGDFSLPGNQMTGKGHGRDHRRFFGGHGHHQLLAVNHDRSGQAQRQGQISDRLFHHDIREIQKVFIGTCE
jgi:hypothetical protein